jgi:hypothetical protein
MPKPKKLDWQQKGGHEWGAVSGRWTYGITEGSSGGFFPEGKTGTWTPLHGDRNPPGARNLLYANECASHTLSMAPFGVPISAKRTRRSVDF